MLNKFSATLSITEARSRREVEIDEYMLEGVKRVAAKKNLDGIEDNSFGYSVLSFS